MAASQDLQSIVDNLILTPEGSDISSGYFPVNTFFKKVLNKPNAIITGSGSKVKVPITVGGMTTTIGTSPYVSMATAAATTFDALEFDYQHASVSTLISEVEIAQSGGESGLNLLKAKINNLKESMQEKLNTGIYTDDGSAATEVVGIPGAWYGSSYGGVTRSGATRVLASNTAFDISAPTGGWVKYGGGANVADVPAMQETKWNCNNATAAGKSAEEVVAMLISDAFAHVSEDGNAADMIVVSKDVLSQLLTFSNEKGGLDKYGVQKSITATDNPYGLSIFGVPVVSDQNVPSRTAYVLNTKFWHVGAPPGFDPVKINPVVQDYPLMPRVKSLSELKTFILLCRNSRRQAWLYNLPQST